MTVSTDSAKEIAIGRRAHGLKATMLADPKLAVIDLFGYRNSNFNNFKPIPTRPGLPVPTTLLIDESGQVIWKDQSENYTQRSDPQVLDQAIARLFNPVAASKSTG